MKAILHERYGVDAVELRDVPVPEPGEGEVRVRVRAASVNPIEFYEVYAPPFIRLLNAQLRKPKDPRLGTDVAGTVEAVGAGVSDLVPGDEVFGVCGGAWAEYAVAKADRLARKPSGVGDVDAAAAPVAGMTALFAVRDHAAVKAGDKVLVNGASGGVGTYAVQIAKALGADVTAVCSTRNVEQTRALGADRVIDYTTEDFTKSDERYDALIDVAGSRSYLSCRHVLTHDATVVIVGAKMSSSFLGPLKHIVGAKLQSIGHSQKAKFFVSKITTEELENLGRLMEAGTVRSVIDQHFALSAAADAIRYLAEGHARGKVIIDV